MFISEREVHEYQIGISKLAGDAGKLAAGRVYVVMHDADIGLEVACRTVVAACALGRAVWISDTPSAYLGVSAKLAREVSECLREGGLRIFQTKSGERGGMCRRIPKELDFLGAARGSLILVGGVDRSIKQATAEIWASDVAAWQKWAERTGCTVLWMHPLRCGQYGHEADFLRMAHRFSGLARLRKSGDGVRWEVYYWFANEGLTADKSFGLDTDGSGNWWVDERYSPRAEAVEPAVDEDDVFIMRTALPCGRSAPSGWRVCETIEQMIGELSSAHAPTVVFGYNVNSRLETLARSIFELRRLIGPYVKIAVKETGRRLRQNHEQVLLSMGANLLIPGETGFVRMLSLLKLIQRQTYSRALSSSFEEAMSGMMDVTQTGYLPPADFMGAVLGIMERTKSLEVHNALVRLSLTPGLGILEILRCCTIKRLGDLCTTDDKSMYIFLFSCEEQNVGATLDRLFRLPVSVLFSTELRYLSTEDIADALAELNRRTTKMNYEDFTPALGNNFFADTQPAAASAQPPTRRAFTATPHALTLRAAHA